VQTTLKAKAPGPQRSQALEQPSPRTAHVAKIGLSHGPCKQNLGNKKVINDEAKRLPSDYVGVLPIKAHLGPPGA
jgi:hypothetical protein